MDNHLHGRSAVGKDGGCVFVSSRYLGDFFVIYSVVFWFLCCIYVFNVLGSFHVKSPKIQNQPRTLVSDFLYITTKYSILVKKTKYKV